MGYNSPDDDAFSLFHQRPDTTTPSFQNGTTFPMFGNFYFSKPTIVSFVGAAFFVDGSFATIRGTAGVNRKTGAVTTLTGVFIASSVFHEGCFSSGNFTSKRVF